MSEKVNLTRARIVEFTHPDTNSRLVAIRLNLTSDLFHVCVANDQWLPIENAWRMDSLRSRGANIRILAEFELELTLADLLPDGCEAFRFKGKDTAITDIAIFDAGFQTWEVTGHDGDFAALTDLQRELDVDLDSVVPLVLTAHPDYVEARR